jgi:hypothetical protein
VPPLDELLEELDVPPELVAPDDAPLLLLLSMTVLPGSFEEHAIIEASTNEGTARVVTRMDFFMVGGVSIARAGSWRA